MNHDQVIDLLSMVTAYDRRTVGESDVHAWHAAIGDLPFTDARQAVVEHYRESRDWIMPADIRRLVRSIRAARMQTATVPQPPSSVDPDDTAAYQDWLRNTRRALADGRAPAPDDRADLQPRPLPKLDGTTRHIGDPPNDEYRRAREAIRRERPSEARTGPGADNSVPLEPTGPNHYETAQNATQET